MDIIFSSLRVAEFDHLRSFDSHFKTNAHRKGRGYKNVNNNICTSNFFKVGKVTGLVFTSV